MPSRNIVKEFVPESFYHVYNRGVAKQKIYLDKRDKQYFLKLLARHLDLNVAKQIKTTGIAYRKFSEVELLCYCLMGNHFHLLIYQGENTKAITDFMRCVLTAYTMYFNRKYKRVGPLFQSVYKSSRITTDEYLLHITRYIHMNPKHYKNFTFSSLSQYLGAPCPDWLMINRILELLPDEGYLQFLEDYKQHRNDLEEIKYQLVDT